MPVALFLVPLLTMVANMFDRRGSFSVVITQEYAPVASVVFYVLIAVNLGAILIAVFFHFSGIQAAHVASAIEAEPQARAMVPLLGSDSDAEAQALQQLKDPRILAENLFRMVKFGLLSIGLVLAVREVFRVSAMRAFTITVISAIAMLPILGIWGLLFPESLARRSCC